MGRAGGGGEGLRCKGAAEVLPCPLATPCVVCFALLLLLPPTVIVLIIIATSFYCRYSP